MHDNDSMGTNVGKGCWSALSTRMPAFGAVCNHAMPPIVSSLQYKAHRWCVSFLIWIKRTSNGLARHARSQSNIYVHWSASCLANIAHAFTTKSNTRIYLSIYKLLIRRACKSCHVASGRFTMLYCLISYNFFKVLSRVNIFHVVIICWWHNILRAPSIWWSWLLRRRQFGEVNSLHTILGTNNARMPVCGIFHQEIWRSPISRQ